MFAHVKSVYTHKDDKNGNIWVKASSGMYLLPIATVSIEYVPDLIRLFKALRLTKSKIYQQLLERGQKSTSTNDLEATPTNKPEKYKVEATPTSKPKDVKLETTPTKKHKASKTGATDSGKKRRKQNASKAMQKKEAETDSDEYNETMPLL